MWEKIRELAFSWKYQTLLKAGKTLDVRIFNNVIDFSYVQLYFLHWLIIAHSLYERLAMDDEHLNEDVLKDFIRIEAYLYCESIRKENKKYQKESEKNEIDENHPESFEFVFLKPRN